MADKKKTVDSKAMLKDLANNNVKVKFTERKKVEILEDTAYYKKGQIVNPHITFADRLIKDKIGKEVKE